MKIETHLIQNFPPSCLNRDDTNTPKDCEFGGVRRARISSQCIKRSIRMFFREGGLCDTAMRTKRLKEELTRRLATGDLVSAVLDLFLETYYSKMDSKRPDETAVLLYVGDPEIAEAVKCIQEKWDEMARIAEARADGKKDSVLKADKAVAERLRHAGLAPDIALFGRMLAEKPEMNVEAACQVAHAISTHRVNPEMDFFTAVDDLKSASEAEEDAGAGMLGVTGYNSACFYRYSLVDLRHLSDHLKDPKVAMDVTGAFLRGSVFAIPTGKQTSMAAQNLPSFGMFVVRDSGAPCSLANAFAAPVNVRRDDEDLIGLSIRALANQWDEMATVYGTQGVLATALFCLPAYEERLGALAGSNCGSVDGAVAAVMAAVRG